MKVNEHTIHSMMGAINHWWDGWHRYIGLDIGNAAIREDEIPFWVTNLVDTVRELTGETFDFRTGKWSGD